MGAVERREVVADRVDGGDDADAGNEVAEGGGIVEHAEGGSRMGELTVRRSVDFRVTARSVSAYTSPMKWFLSLGVLVSLASPSFADTRLEIKVTKQGFEPEEIKVPAQKPVTLVFTRKTNATCTKSVVIKLDGDKKIERDLPLDKPVEIAVTFPKAGKLAYACSMDMNKGTILVQ